MAVTVHVPSHMRDTSGGPDRVEVPAGTLRAVIDALDAECPGIKRLIVDGGRVRSDLAIAVNTTITHNDLSQPVADGDEIHLVPAIAGG